MIGFDSGSMTTTMLMVGVDDVVVGNTTSMCRELLFVRVRLCFFLLTMNEAGESFLIIKWPSETHRNTYVVARSVGIATYI